MNIIVVSKVAVCTLFSSVLLAFKFQCKEKMETKTKNTEEEDGRDAQVSLPPMTSFNSFGGTPAGQQA